MIESTIANVSSSTSENESGKKEVRNWLTKFVLAFVDKTNRTYGMQSLQAN